MMKKILCGVFLLAVINVYSQSVNKLSYGIKTGLAFANTQKGYNNNSASEIKVKTGFMAGGFLNFSLGKSLVFQPALLYVRKGGNEFTGNSYSIPFHFNYLEIPLNLLYKSGTGRGTYFLGGGLSPALHLNSEYYGSEIKDFDLGINFLAVYKIPIGFSINLGYTYGLINASSNKGYIKTIKNRYFSITVGYEFLN
jgi:Outer membrane protein beta-barrel domain